MGAQIDTSDSIHFSTPYAKEHALKTFYRWEDLNPFTQGFVEAAHAEWPRLDLPDRRMGSYEWGFSDLAPETLARFIEDCKRFKSGDRGVYSYDWDNAGRAFWAMRQSQVGVPDFPPLRLYLDDDGKVRIKTTKEAETQVWKAWEAVVIR